MNSNRVGRGRTLRVAICLSVVFAMLTSCDQASSSWYPAGKASIALSYESSDNTSKSCFFTAKVTNTGTTKIGRSTVSVSVATDARTYFKTISSNESILPGGSVFVEGSVTYARTPETLNAIGVLVIEQFYQ